jgi:PAS domain S-box-containing protein
MAGTNAFFDFIFNNSRQNGMFIMSEEGIIQQVNEAFTTAYGYTTDDLQSQHFRILFIEKDQATRKPEIELSTTIREGAGIDENYLVHKDGTPIWVSGESIHIKSDENTCIVKIIHNIHAQKQLERYLLDSSKLLESLFDSIQQAGLLLLNSQMKIIKTNKAFIKIFNLNTVPTEGSKLNQVEHVFWTGEEIKNDIRNAIVNNTAINKEFTMDDGKKACRLHIASKLIVSEESMEKKLLLIIKEI